MESSRICTISEVRKAMEARKECTIGPVVVYLVNWDAQCRYPRRFTYLACSKVGKWNNTCMKTIEGPNRCEHNSLEHGTWLDSYRFNLTIVDGSVGVDCPPLRASVFDAARTILKKSAGDFSLLDEEDQVATITGAIDKIPLVECWVRVQKSTPVIQKILLYGAGLPVTPASRLRTVSGDGFSTPANYGGGLYSTPATRFSGGAARESSQKHPNVKKGDFDSLKARVKEMEELLNNMEISHGV
ncbi:unnamed protein product [Calypogeia fissa]